MIHKKTIKDFDVKGKKVFCRVDFNVPMENEQITDETRIVAAIPTIEYLAEQGAIVILASHLGRAEGGEHGELRLGPGAQRLTEVTDKPVLKRDAVHGAEVDQAISQMNNGDLLLSEAVRVDAGETPNDPQLVEAFTNVAD